MCDILSFCKIRSNQSSIRIAKHIIQIGLGIMYDIMESQSKSRDLIYVTTNSWDNDVLKSDLPILVDFWAEWCGPCRMVGPAIEELSHTMKGKIKVAKVNVDENQEISMRHGIKSIPSLLLFKGGKEIARTVGAASKEAYQKFLEQSLSDA